MPSRLSPRTKYALVLFVSLLCMFGAGHVLALFDNGSFEAGDFSGWVVEPVLNQGLTLPEPYSGQSINLAAGGLNTSTILGGPGTPHLSLSDPDITDIKFPRFGNYVARLGDKTINNNTNVISQSTVVAASDIDPFDKKVHARFAFLPVMENPLHNSYEQPFFYIALRNLDTNELLYENFTFSGQAGVPWKAWDTSGALLYLDWQVVDIIVGDSSVVGDRLQLYAIAAACSLGGHYGYVYLDGFGPFLPGLFVTKTAPSTIEPGDSLTYDFVARNTGSETLNNVVVQERIPDQTTFVSVSDKRCQANGKILSCNFGTLRPRDGISFRMTTTVALTATGDIVNGDYKISGDNYPALLGQTVITKVINPTSVNLQRFSAIHRDGKVLIDWQTSAEFHTLGYLLYRSTTGHRHDAERITPNLIPSIGPSGGTYHWEDTTAQPGIVYSYWLAETAADGSDQEYGPTFTAGSTLLGQRLFIPLTFR